LVVGDLGVTAECWCVGHFLVSFPRLIATSGSDRDDVLGEDHVFLPNHRGIVG